jgi:hypothetical protein
VRPLLAYLNISTINSVRPTLPNFGLGYLRAFFARQLLLTHNREGTPQQSETASAFPNTFTVKINRVVLLA